MCTGGNIWLSTQASGFLVLVGDQEISWETGTGQPLKFCPELCDSRRRRISPSAASLQSLDPCHKVLSHNRVINFTFTTNRYNLKEL